VKRKSKHDDDQKLGLEAAIL